MSKPATVDEYIDRAHTDAKIMLKEIRGILKEIVPDATEAIRWGYPVLIEKRILFSYSAHKDHLNFMPTRTSLEPFLEELKEYTTGRDTIQFSYDKPLPKSLIQKIAKYRYKEVVEEGSLWMHNEQEAKRKKS